MDLNWRDYTLSTLNQVGSVEKKENRTPQPRQIRSFHYYRYKPLSINSTSLGMDSSNSFLHPRIKKLKMSKNSSSNFER